MWELFVIALLPVLSSSASSRNAVVTLVTGTNSGYVSGALALGQSLFNVRSKLHRVVMVTPDVEETGRALLSSLYEVIEVEPIFCQHKIDKAVDPLKYDLQGEKYRKGVQVLPVESPHSSIPLT